MGIIRIILIVLCIILVIRFLRRLLIGLASALRRGTVQNSSQSSTPQRYKDVKDVEFEDLNDKPTQ